MKMAMKMQKWPDSIFIVAGNLRSTDMQALIAIGAIPLAPQGPKLPPTYLPVLSELAVMARAGRLPDLQKLPPALQTKKRNLPPLIRVMTGEEVLPGWAWAREPKKAGQCALCPHEYRAGKVPWGTYFAHEICVVRCLAPKLELPFCCDRCHTGYKYRAERIGLCGRCRYL